MDLKASGFYKGFFQPPCQTCLHLAASFPHQKLIRIEKLASRVKFGKRMPCKASWLFFFFLKIRQIHRATKCRLFKTAMAYKSYPIFNSDNGVKNSPIREHLWRCSDFYSYINQTRMETFQIALKRYLDRR